MKWLSLATLILWTLGLCGCSSTRIYRNGQLVFTIQGDATNVTFRSGDTYFHADRLVNSKATSAAYAGVGEMIGAVASGVAAAGILFK